jgi:sialic acid synthase SpsE
MNVDPVSEIEIDGKKIGKKHPTYFIADIAANHDGSLERAKKLIKLAALNGANAAKFQHFSAGTIVSDKGFRDLATKKSHQNKWNKSVFDVYQDATINLDWTEDLVACCKEYGISFFTSPYSIALVDYIDQYVPAYKVGSGDISWLEIIEHISKKGKPYILATGASTLDDVVNAVNAGLVINNKFVLMQCNTNYTASIENLNYVNLNVLKTYEAMYPDMILGLSDHTPGHTTVLGAVALGARVVEKHFTDDTSRNGPDHAFSMDPNSWEKMVLKTRELEAALGAGLKKVEKNEEETYQLQRRSLRLTRNIEAGEKIKVSDIEVLRPAPLDCMPINFLKQILGKELNNSKDKGDYIRVGDILV